MTNYLWFLTRSGFTINSIFFSEYSLQNISETLQNTLFYIQNLFPTVKGPYDILSYIIIPFLLFIIISLVILLIANRYGFEKKLILKKEIDNRTNDFLTEIIFSNHETSYIKEKINEFKKEIPFKKKWCRDIVLNKIITIKRNINGVSPNQMLLIYKYFGFHYYSNKLIRSRSWENKLLGIYHYQILEYKIKTGYIRPNIYVKNKFLKSNALIAVISLSDQKFDFLSNYKKKISTADELKILDIIYQKKSSLPQKINEWLYNENTSITILAIKLMIRYRESLNISQITYLLSHSDKTVRKETLLAIRNLYVTEANSVLIDYYNTEIHKRNKISALKTFGAVGNTETKNFILSLLQEEKDLEVKFEMVHCIHKIDRNFFKNYTVKDESENDIVSRIVLHVNNPYLN